MIEFLGWAVVSVVGALLAVVLGAALVLGLVTMYGIFRWGPGR